MIEDLDRLDDNDIFDKLRDLNQRLNKEKKQNKIKWKFIYQLKDTSFLDKRDELKFFDYVMPIVPFVSVKSSFDKIKNLFSNHKKIKGNLIYQISNMITDYRLKE